MTRTGCLFLTDRQDQGPIHGQCLDRRPTYRRSAPDTDALPAEVLAPDVATRMEQSHQLTAHGINSSLARCLAQGAGNASERQVVGDRRTASLDRNDVVDVEGRFLTLLRQPAILTPPTGSLHHKPSKLEWNRLIQGSEAATERLAPAA